MNERKEVKRTKIVVTAQFHIRVTYYSNTSTDLYNSWYLHLVKSGASR